MFFYKRMKTIRLHVRLPLGAGFFICLSYEWNREEVGSHRFKTRRIRITDFKNLMKFVFRFRNLSGVADLRDTIIRRMVTFLVRPLASECPARWRCAQMSAEDTMHHFISRWLFLDSATSFFSLRYYDKK